MRKYITLFFSVSVFLFACNSNKTQGDIISHDRMISLLTDIHIIDGRMYARLAPDSLYKYGTGMYMALFKKYHTDSAQFKRSFKYYTNKPDELATIYDQVLKNLKQKSDSLNKVQLNIIKQKSDSLNKVQQNTIKQKSLNALPQK